MWNGLDMNSKRKFYVFTLWVVFSILLFTLPGCVRGKRVEKEPLFNKWKAMAEKSRGYSPTAKRRVIHLQKKAGAKAPEQVTEAPLERPLPTQKISMKMHNIEVAVLLRALARAANQNIMISDRVKGTTSINIEKAPWDQVFNAILRTNGLTYVWQGNIIRIMTVEDMERDLKRETQKRGLRLVEPLLTRIIHVDYSDAKKLQKNLQKFLTKDKDGKPLGSILVDEHTNALIIQAIRDDMERLIPLIEKLDRPTPQILIEAHIVEATRETARELGIQWGGLVRHTGNVNTYITPGARSTGVLGQPLSVAGIDPTSGMAVNFPAALGNTGLSVGFVAEKLGQQVLAVQLSALQKEGKLHIISNPSITTIDNQKAVIESGKEVPYQTVENDETQIEYKKVLLRLEVTPHVIQGKTLKLEIVTSKDELDWANAVQGNPAIATKKAKTNVILEDGQTTVIGGLNKEKTDVSESGVPWLKEIPLLGYFFKGTANSKNMEDVLIFITPRILKERIPGQEDQPEVSKSQITNPK